MAERERPDGDGRGECPADAVGRIGIVVAGDPDPVAAVLERRDRGAVRHGEARGTAAVMEAVAERDHASRRITHDQPREPGERRRGVIGRQQRAAPRKAGSFFQVQVGDDEQALVRPIQRAEAVGMQSSARDHDRGAGRAFLPPLPLKGERAG